MEKTKKQFEEENETLRLNAEQISQDLRTALKERDIRIQNFLDKQKEFDALKLEHKGEVNNLKKEIEVRDKKLEVLSSKFNDLAKLFDEHLKGFDDIMEVQKLFLRNNIRTQELLQIKIKTFNGEGDKK